MTGVIGKTRPKMISIRDVFPIGVYIDQTLGTYHILKLQWKHV